MKEITVLLIIAVMFSCSSKRKHINEVDIILEYAQSYKFNINEGVYTIFYSNKPPSEIKFELTNDEKSNIMTKYYSLELDEIQGLDKTKSELYFEDRCEIMPKKLTKLTVKTKSKAQQFIIDEKCEKFSSASFKNANKVKDFLMFIKQVLQSKSEIRSAPKTNIVYL